MSDNEKIEYLKAQVKAFTDAWEKEKHGGTKCTACRLEIVRIIQQFLFEEMGLMIFTLADLDRAAKHEMASVQQKYKAGFNPQMN